MTENEAEGLTVLTVMYSRAWFIRVFIELSYDEDDGFKLVQLRRIEGSQAGAGREILNLLCQAADLLNEPITLECSKDLVSYYESFGFSPLVLDTLQRLPRRVNRQLSHV